MLDEPVIILDDYLREAVSYHMDLIRGDNPSAFTRIRKITPHQILCQALGRKPITQDGNLDDFYDVMKKERDITEVGFFKARCKFNPEAIRVMSNEYVSNIYDNYDDSIKKWKGLVVLAVDGSKIIVPSTEENYIVFGKHEGNGETQPAMALISTLHDCLNSLKLDVQIDRIDGSERELAAKHIDTYCDNYIQKAIFTFDRGYPSIKLIDQLINKNQYFLFRCPSTMFKNYFSQIAVGESKFLDVTFDRVNTNEYRNDIPFRTHLLNTTYHLRFAKIVIGKNEDGTDNVEYLITNLPFELCSDEELKELYWCRWNIETSYLRLKNRMKMEEFSGYKSILIKQDIYADAWIFNLVALKIIYSNEHHPIDEDHGEYTVKKNFNKAIGTMRKNLLKALFSTTAKERSHYLNIIDTKINTKLSWVKKGDRQFERKQAVNKSDMSYRKDY